MKKIMTTRKIIAMLISILLLVSACDQIFNLKESLNDEYVTLDLSASEIDRTVTVTEVTIASYTLLGTIEGGSESTLGTWTSLTDASVVIAAGTWDFTLNAYDSDKKLVLSGTLSGQNIAASGNLSFSLSPLTSGTGVINVSVRWPTIVRTVDSVSITLGSNDPVIVKSSHFGILTVENVVYYNVSYKNTSAVAGNQTLGFKLYDASSQLMASITEKVKVRQNLTSSKIITLSSSDLNSAPGAPAGVTASVVSSSGTSCVIKLGWTDNSTNESGFNIYRNGSSTAAGSVSAAVTTYTDTVSRGTAYTYSVSAVNSFGESTAVSSDVITVAAEDAAALSASDITFATGDSSASVFLDFTLPTSLDSGSTVSWVSGNTNVISISGGAATVTKPGSDTTVTLTASVTDSDGKSASKAITLIVVSHKWILVGSAGFSAGDTSYHSLAFDSGNTPYLAYRDKGNSDKATVMKFNGSAWGNVGSAGFSAGAASNTSLALDSGNMPYVAYDDGGNSYKATVMKFNGSAWEVVGTPGFSAGEVANTSLAIDSGNTPFVAYGDSANSSRATVMKYNGSTWEAVGTAGFSAGGVSNTSLALDSSDTPYVAYQDGGNGYKATVMKFNGSAWVNVGSTGFSSGVASDISQALDSSDTPYVAYRDNGKATVMKFNGSAWEAVGTEGFSAGYAYYLSFALDSANTPYVAYQDNEYSAKTTVMKYNGSAWEVVGTAGFSAGTVYYTSLAFDSADMPYVAYEDDENSGKATVMKFE